MHGVFLLFGFKRVTSSPFLSDTVQVLIQIRMAVVTNRKVREYSISQR